MWMILIKWRSWKTDNRNKRDLFLSHANWILWSQNHFKITGIGVIYKKKAKKKSFVFVVVSHQMKYVAIESFCCCNSIKSQFATTSNYTTFFFPFLHSQWFESLGHVPFYIKCTLFVTVVTHLTCLLNYF